MKRFLPIGALCAVACMGMAVHAMPIGARTLMWGHAIVRQAAVDPSPEPPPAPVVWTVTFDANGGAVAEAKRAVTNGCAVGALPDATKDGSAFDGWFTAASGGEAVTVNTVVTGDVTFYAHWAIVSPDPVTPDPVTPDPVTPDPVTPDPVTPAPVTPDPVIPDPVTPDPVTPDPLIPDPVTPDPVIPDPVKPNPVTPDPVTPDPVKPDSVTPDSVTPDPVTPYPVTPDPDTPVTLCYEVIEAKDIVAPYSAPKAVTLQGAVYNGCDVVGIVELKLGKVNQKKKTGKISGTLTDIYGKKHKIASKKLAGVEGDAPLNVQLEVKDYGTMDVTVGYREFAGSLGKLHVQTADVNRFGKTAATVKVAIGDLSMFTGKVVKELLPTDGVVGMTVGKWSFDKAPGVKWAKIKDMATMSYPEYFSRESGKGLVVGEGRNPSGMKLTYTAKKGTFKGSFKVYELQGEGTKTKLKKYTVKVTGVVVDGVGYGMATCKKPAVTWSVLVE